MSSKLCDFSIINVKFIQFQVRQLCVEKTAPRKDVVSSFIKRLWDVDVHVRFAAYKRLCTLSGFLKVESILANRYFLHM